MKPLLVVTGEISGEIHALECLRQLSSMNFDCYGMGSQLLAEHGVKLLVDTKELHVMGIKELFGCVGKLYSAWKTLKTFIQQKKPLVILVDYPDFNLRLAKVAKQSGCKVLYLVSPTVWAWRAKRIELVRRWIDKMMVIYPFEVEYYRQRGIAVTYVGNVLLRLVERHKSVEELRQLYGLKKEIMTLGLFPGSRKSELKYLLPTMLETAKVLAKQMKLQLILPKAVSISSSFLTEFLLGYPDLSIQVLDNSYDAITLSDVILAASGTVTLEIAFLEKPLVLIYRGRWWEYLFAKFFLKIPNIGLCNILARKQVAPEFLQDKVQPKFLVPPLLSLLQDPKIREKQVKAFQQIKEEFLKTPTTSFTTIVENLGKF